ncbi:hypothetical protein E6O75_ATG02254 [Venturia nashicola]|uniref:Uncharacterized protein n=1 Tax=Venturia nashicola TaxID=86259 RepID=A0A4Z1PIN0_9PEZI|nr:hypothetical protein E6O75_ATG02254 [Venturia nashicola]
MQSYTESAHSHRNRLRAEVIVVSQILIAQAANLGTFARAVDASPTLCLRKVAEAHRQIRSFNEEGFGASKVPPLPTTATANLNAWPTSLPTKQPFQLNLINTPSHHLYTPPPISILQQSTIPIINNPNNLELRPDRLSPLPPNSFSSKPHHAQRQLKPRTPSPPRSLARSHTTHARRNPTPAIVIMGFNVQHQMHQYTVIPKVLYVRRWGLKRWSLAFGSKGRITYT